MHDVTRGFAAGEAKGGFGAKAKAAAIYRRKKVDDDKMIEWERGRGRRVGRRIGGSTQLGPSQVSPLLAISLILQLADI